MPVQVKDANGNTVTIDTINDLLAALQTASGRAFEQISDGMNSPSIKPASVAPVASDPALVVALSPNGAVSIAPSTTDVSETPAVTASAYSSGYVLGGIMTFANLLASSSFNGVLQSIAAKFKGTVVTGSLEVAIFKAPPSNGTYNDHAAPAWNSADMANLVGVYTLSSPNSKLGTMTVYNLDGIGKALVGASQSLYAVVIVDGTPTPASTSDFTLELSVLPG